MIDYKVVTTSDKLEKFLVRVSNTIKDFTVPLEKSKFIMLRSVDLNFQREGRPIHWKPLSEMTKKFRRKKGAGAKILQDTGRLKRSISAIPIKDGIRVGTNVQYASVLQLGGSIPIPARTIVPVKAKALHFFMGGKEVFAKSVNQKARTHRIPPRPFILFQSQDKKDIVEVFGKHIDSAVR